MSFKDSLKTKDFVVTAQVNLAQALEADTLLQQAEILAPAVDAVQLSDSNQIHMSGLAAAALLLQRGIDPIIHMNCRDRNRVALHKDLIGGAALGVTSILIMRGKRIPDNNPIGVRNVFDVPALEFIAYIHSLKQDEDSSLLSEYFVGANARIIDPEADWTPISLVPKCDAGANFVQLQACFDMEIARNYMARIVETKLTHKASFIMTLAPLPSADIARWLRQNVKDAIVPESIIKRLDQASDPEREGIEICAELMRELTTISGVSGVNLLTPGKLESVPAAINASGVRTS